MKTNANQYGFVASLIIHLLIFVIPLSCIVKKEKEVIEFFVSIEDAYKNPDIIEAKKEVIKQTKREKNFIESADKIIEPERPVEKIEEISEKPLLHNKVNEEPRKDVIQEEQDVITKTVSANKELEKNVATVDTEFGSAIAPSFLHKEIPEYPLIAKKLGKEGKVVLRLTIDENGRLVNIEVVEKAGYGFTESAIEAVKKSTFLPAKKDGVPVMSRAMLPIKFILRRN